MRRENSVGADDFAALRVAHHQVIAIRIENIVIHPRRTARQVGAHFPGKNPVTQTLGLKDIALAAGKANRKTGPFGAALLDACLYFFHAALHLWCGDSME